ncbi:hypothetical protein Zm00014a_002950 [Zea mays]|uniref:BTB/POZ domain-containing protein n=3 Tax=Zea mays TaxID=4577 RepID=A0A8J8YQS7_MAIZE|nr:BTB/POZ domain-containing protein [Zea mays]ONM09644.1 BTB/POZ domain-containing protein [Zea mays]PWZ52907.1 hypothetical protein Zm00014a_002950 [Zea mays]PWZ52908.1 hypothetical protein Zm00014a_002950 [Zea mays]PWZ52909.1 BTB/POZ domain-containing protein [Zea mays]
MLASLPSDPPRSPSALPSRALGKRSSSPKLPSEPSRPPLPARRIPAVPTIACVGSHPVRSCLVVQFSHTVCGGVRLAPVSHTVPQRIQSRFLTLRCLLPSPLPSNPRFRVHSGYRELAPASMAPSSARNSPMPVGRGSRILTRFLLHYLRAATRRPPALEREGAVLAGLADTTVHGMALVEGTTFSCRALFWVLRIVSAVGLSKECRHKLERLMGLMLVQATLDDLLVSSDDGGGMCIVNLVMRLVRVFVASKEEADTPSKRMRKVGRLVNKYLDEISQDQGLKVSKFLTVAESLPDSARDCYNGMYRVLDIYLEMAYPKTALLTRMANMLIQMSLQNPLTLAHP